MTSRGIRDAEEHPAGAAKDQTASSRARGVGTAETPRTWVRRAGAHAGQRPRLTSEENALIKWLQRENADLRANEILKAASVFFAGPGRPRRCP